MRCRPFGFGEVYKQAVGCWQSSREMVFQDDVSYDNASLVQDSPNQLGMTRKEM